MGFRGDTRKMKTVIQMHGCGYGDDGPLFTPKFKGLICVTCALKKATPLFGSPLP